MSRNSKTFFILLALLVLPAAQALCAINWNEFKQPFDNGKLQSYPYYDCFKRASERYNLPMLLLLSVAKGESNFNTNAIGRKDGKPIAYGVMQINYKATARDVGYKAGEPPEVLMNDPCRNIDAGSQYLAFLMKRYDGDIYLVLAAYFSGPSRIRKGSVPDYGDDYAKYIYAKLASIKGRSYSHEVYCNLIAFDRFLFAENYRNYIHIKDKSIPLDINKNSLNQYVVRITAQSGQARNKFKDKIEKVTGLRIDCRR